MTLAWTEISVKNFEKALEYCNKVLEINPQSFNAWCLKAGTTVLINIQKGVFEFSDEVLIYFYNAINNASEEEEKIVIKKSLLPMLLHKNLLAAVDSSIFSDYMKKKAMRETYVDKLKKVLKYFPDDEMIMKRINEINKEIQILNTKENDRKEKLEKKERNYRRKESNKKWFGAFISLGTVLGFVLAIVHITGEDYSRHFNTKSIFDIGGVEYFFLGLLISIIVYIIFATIRYLLEK